MKIAITGDWHLTNKRPENRIDDYVKAQEDKIVFIFKTMKENNVWLLLQPGDMTDKWESPDRFKTRIIKLFREVIRDIMNLYTIVSVPGQHDIRFHTSPTDNTPFGVFAESLDFLIASKSPIPISNIDIYGAPWNAPIPKISNKNRYNILVTHRLVSDVQNWPGMNYDSPGSLLRKTGFDLIVSGDNHKWVEYSENGKILINCGSLMRSKIDQVGHEPSFYILDTETKEFRRVLIPIVSPEEVFDLEKTKAEKEKDQKNLKLIEALRAESKINGIDFRKNMSDTISDLKERNEISKDAYGIYEEVFNV